jgi:hypothetical protein
VPTDLKPAAKRLVAEFQTKLSLSEVYSRRAAFVVLAVSHGWQKAKIARYLGVHRQRVGQQVAKYTDYAESGDWPQIAAAFSDIKPSTDPENGNGHHVSFSKAEWESLDFANDMLNRLV